MFVETEEQSLLRDAVDPYFRKSAETGKRDWSRDEWHRLANELGILGAPFPEELGGAGGTLGDAMIIMELLGKHLLVRPYLECVVMAGRAIAASANPGRRQLIEAISAGEMIVAPAWAEAGAGDNLADVAMLAKPDGEGGYRLWGGKIMVRAAPWATHILVSARVTGDQHDPAGIALFLVPADAAGLIMRPARTIDGYACADLAFDAVAVAAATMIADGETGHAALSQMIAEATAAVCIEGIGIIDSLIALTVEYTGQRKAFGKTLASFQVLQHGMVDMQVTAEYATSVARAAAAVVADASPDTPILVSAAKYVMNLALESVGRAAVQYHGAVGLMDETPVSWYFKRSVVIKHQFGSAARHLDGLAARAGSTIQQGEHGHDMVADLCGVDSDPAVGAFQDEVRAFLRQELTADLRRLCRWETNAFARPETSIPWQKALAARGWAAPSWPQEYGGPGWSARQRQVFEKELAMAGAPRLPAMGMQMVAPVLMRYGTPEQKARFLPAILAADEYWCQGYSEPNAGSDLAGLQLQAVRDGDDYLLNGSKMWTTFAQYADWIFVLARTSKCERRQDGISFILVPLNTPGVTIRPLISMSGEHEVNQVFFDDARVPVANLVGEENDGWQVAKYLLEFERGVGHQVPALVHELARLRETAQAETGEDGQPVWASAPFRRRYADLEARTLAIRLTEERMVYALPAGQNIGDATAAIMKLGWSEMGQEIDELMIEAVGPYAMVDQQLAAEANDAAKIIGPAHADTPIRRYLDDRVLTLAGGSSEILRTILARVVLK